MCSVITCGGAWNGRKACLATSGGVSRTVAHVPAVSLAQVSTAQSRRQRHGAVAGRAAVHVLETADFGFEFAAFFLLGLREVLVILSCIP
jgi:hypothetical protein